MPSRRLRPLALTFAAALALAVPASASAETISWTATFYDVFYDAGSSFNVNHVAISQSGDKLVLTDQNTITVSNPSGQPQCHAITTKKAECDSVANGAPGFDIGLALGSGNDVLDAGNSNLKVIASGWNGMDELHGQAAGDILIGGPDDDSLYGNGGDDVFSDDQALTGAPDGFGNDKFYGEAGNDQLLADENPKAGVSDHDLMDGGSEVDVADYSKRTVALNLSLNAIADDGQAGEGDNLVSVENVLGGAAPDVIAGSAGVNELHGNSDNDTIAGGAGADKLYGEFGDDTLSGGPGGDLYSGGPGRDSVSFAAAAAPVTVRLDGLPNDGESGEGDSVESDVEVVTGSSADDTFFGDLNPNELDAGPGADTLDGGDGADVLRGSDGADSVVGGAGDDTIDAGVGGDSVEAGPGDDKIDLRDGEKDTVTCGGGNDTVEADAQDEAFTDCEVVNRAAATPGDMTPDGPGGGGTNGNGGGDGGNGMAPLLHAAIGPAKVKVDKRGRGTLLVGCPAAAPSACNAGVVLATKAKKPSKLAAAGFKAAPGATKKVRFKLSGTGRARLKKAKRLKATVTVAAKKGVAAPMRTRRTVTLVLKRR